MSSALKLSEYYEFIRWLALPYPFREAQGLPLEQKELAEKLGVHETTLSRWKQDPNFREDLRREIEKWAVEQTPNVIAALLKKIMQGDASSTKLWLQYFEGFQEKTKVEHEGEIKQTVQVEVREEKKVMIMNAFANFGIIKEPKDDKSTPTIRRGRRADRKPRIKTDGSKGK